MRRSLLLTIGALLLACLGVAAPKKEPTLRCTLTNQKIEQCCCEQRSNKLYCTLAKKTIDKCCCEATDKK